MSNRSKDNQHKANELRSDVQESILKRENEKAAEQINKDRKNDITVIFNYGYIYVG